jgi:NAD(P)-dependent dehydrogenase (short-subunit alcohol dehydrogenase family)
LKPVVLVTGGSRGIGAATAWLAAQQGWAVAVNDTQGGGQGGAIVNLRLAPQIPMQRPGTAEEVAQAIVWLLGEQSSHSTGGIIEATGGR